MRITFLMPADDLTGGNRVVATYARLLQAQGHQVLVLSNAPDRPTLRQKVRAMVNGEWPALRERMRPKPGHIAQSGVPHRVLDTSRPFTAADVPDGDVVIATWWETAVWMHRLPASKGQRVHLIQGYETWTDPAIRSQVHAALRLPNCKIAISDNLRRDIEADLGPLDIQVVPNAVDLDHFNAPTRARHTPPTVGFIYAVAAMKGADVCIRAIEIARQHMPELQVLAFGADAESSALPLPEGTRYVQRPAQDHIPQLYAGCDAWLFGSRIDSFGLPILEAMACRTPVIGVPVGAAPQLLADGVGRLVPPESPEAMAQAMLEVCSLPQADWQDLSERAHRRAHGYSWQDATESLGRILEQALSGGVATTGPDAA